MIPEPLMPIPIPIPQGLIPILIPNPGFPKIHDSNSSSDSSSKWFRFWFRFQCFPKTLIPILIPIPASFDSDSNSDSKKPGFDSDSDSGIWFRFRNHLQLWYNYTGVTCALIFQVYCITHLRAMLPLLPNKFPLAQTSLVVKSCLLSIRVRTTSKFNV